MHAVAAAVDATPAQVALAWLLAQGDDVAPIPGTTKAMRVDENVAALDLRLTAEHLDLLAAVGTPVGERHRPADMNTIDR